MTAATGCVSTEMWVLELQSVPGCGKSTAKVPSCRCCSLGLRCGQGVWLAPQGVLTKLDGAINIGRFHIKTRIYLFS